MEESERAKPKIFIIDDDQSYRKRIVNHLTEKLYTDLTEFDTPDSFLEEISNRPDIVFLNFHMKGLNGIKILRRIRTYSRDIQVVLLSDREKVQIAINAFVYGVSDYVTKGEGDLQRMTFIIRQAENRNELANDVIRLKRKQRIMFAAIACLMLSLGWISWF